MANGIDWFRWHHGSVSDGKFALVAHKAGASVAEVIAVWACMLEAASCAEDRGNPGLPDFEAVDFSLGMQDGKARRIYERMRERSLLDGDTGRIGSWDKRQPKREREGDNSTERVRAFRQSQRQETSGNAMQHQETPREEKSREEEKEQTPKTKAARERAAPPPECPDGVTDQTWRDWLSLRKAKRAPVTETVIREAQAESVKAGLSFDAFLRVWCGRGSQGLSAEWLKPHERGSPTPISRFIKGTSLDPDFKGYDHAPAAALR